jgi:hypothetical protein
MFDVGCSTSKQFHVWEPNPCPDLYAFVVSTPKAPSPQPSPPRTGARELYLQELVHGRTALKKFTGGLTPALPPCHAVALAEAGANGGKGDNFAGERKKKSFGDARRGLCASTVFWLWRRRRCEMFQVEPRTFP